MEVILEIVSGPAAGAAIRLLGGDLVRVGRTEPADYAVGGDVHMSRLHFAVECGAAGARVRDLGSSNGTYVNGMAVSEAALQDGDQIAAGGSLFRVRVAGGPPEPAALRPAETPPAAVADSLLALLRGEFQPLYALVDAARARRAYALLLQAQEERQSLYEGPKGDRLALWAPHLVRLAPDSPLLEALVREGWGKSWGVFLTCPLGFQELRHHLRYFVKVRLPDGRTAFFRFYDPRVLRIYLPTCDGREAAAFFGPIARYLVEDDRPEALLEFTPQPAGVKRRRRELGPPGPGAAVKQPAGEARPDSG